MTDTRSSNLQARERQKETAFTCTRDSAGYLVDCKPAPGSDFGRSLVM